MVRWVVDGGEGGRVYGGCGGGGGGVEVHVGGTAVAVAEGGIARGDVGVWVIEEEEFDVGGREEAGDEIVVEAVDVFEVPVIEGERGFFFLGLVVCR